MKMRLELTMVPSTLRRACRAATFVAALVGTLAASVGAAHSETEAEYRARVAELFADWLEEVRSDATDAGITDETFDMAFHGVSLNWRLPDLTPPSLEGETEGEPDPQREDNRQQPEFDQPVRYFPEHSLNNLVEAGRVRLGRHAATLERIEETYGVQGEIILALWARETSYGRVDIPHYTIRALATQAFMGRRGAFFRGELIDALEILQAGHIDRDGMRSSWAGAMGHTQMMPSEFDTYAVDFDDDGKRDIWNSIPDALATAARNLRDHGWVADHTWGYEVTVTDDFDCTLEGPDNGRPISQWVELGAARTFGRTFTDERLAETGFLLMPAGRFGPAFIVLENFYVLKTYNTSDLYALYIGHLADRLLNNRRFEARWNPVESFTRSDVRDLQERLVARGLDVGGVDGLIGFRTRAAVGSYQKSAGFAPNCYPNPDVIAHIRAADEAASGN
jgi:lytic murein transglycosylase